MRNALANCRRTIVPASATVPNGLNQNAEKFPLDCTIFEADNRHPSTIAPLPDAREKPMTRYMVWVQIENNEGWGCSLCDWLIAPPELDTTVAALKYNHAAQQAFDVHECHQNGNGAKKPPSGIVFSRSAHAGHV